MKYKTCEICGRVLDNSIDKYCSLCVFRYPFIKKMETENRKFYK